MSGVDLTGDAQLRRALDGAADALGDLAVVNATVADLIRTSAIPRVPIRTGRLAGSLTATGTGTDATVSSLVPYAVPVHAGVPALHMPPRPFLTGAVEDATGRIEDAYLAVVDDAFGAVA